MNKMNVCSEIFGLINLLDIADMDKLPISFLDNIVENRNISYNPIYGSFEGFFEDKNTLQESKIIVLYCYYKYLCENDRDKNFIISLIRENDSNNKAINTNSLDNLFNKADFSNLNFQKEKSLIVKKEKWYTRMLLSLKNLFINKS